MDANQKRKLARVIAILAVALGAGQLMQSMAGSDADDRVSHGEVAQKARNIETVAAGAEAAKPKVQPQNSAVATPRLPNASVANTAPESKVAPATAADAKPIVPTAPAVDVAKLDPCTEVFDLANGPNALIGLTLIAPCRPNERVVVKHAGLAVTGKTTATGALFVDIPALEQDAVVEVMFKDGSKLSSAIDVPEATALRRLAVQWQAGDAFAIHAFEDDLGYGGPGDVSAAAPHTPAAGLPAKGGFLTLLGDATTDMPLLAEVYTYPVDPNAKAEVVIEAAVTKASCGREILAETLSSTGGKVEIGDLAAAMPGCDAVGDYLVLKNLVPDLNIAAN